VPVADGADLSQVVEARRLAAVAIAGDGGHHQRNILRTNLLDERFQPGRVEIAFEGMRRARVEGLRNGQIDGPGAGVLDVGPGGVEVCVAGNDFARFTQQFE